MQEIEEKETAGPPDPKESDGLTSKQELALEAVLSHATLTGAAKAAGIGEATLWRYMQDKNFSGRLREARREAVGHAVARLQRASGEAVAVIEELMGNKEAPPAARLSAARMVLDYAVRFTEMEEIRKRVEEIEEKVRKESEEEVLDAAAKKAKAV